MNKLEIKKPISISINIFPIIEKKYGTKERVDTEGIRNDYIRFTTSS